MNWGWNGIADGWDLEQTSSWNAGGHTFVVSSREMIHTIWRSYTYPYPIYL